MSMGGFCTCDERKKPVAERRWLVMDRNCNHSAFNGYHRTASEWSSVRCASCRSIWRTKANYVNRLKDGPQ